ncbi:MAG: glycoside hydrolase family 2 TIM barrel-domain containing protein [Bacteroidales bacterium]
MKKIFLSLLILIAWGATVVSAPQVREERFLEKDWCFVKGDPQHAADPLFDDSSWQPVTIPHDWAIYGPFSREHDLQQVAVTQNFETAASVKTGRTGGLPYVGTGWYRTSFDIAGFNPEERSVSLLFDGAMSEARVYVNGREACFWPNGYNAFHYDITKLLNRDGRNNVLAVRLENRPQSSRWYSGAGLYRNVKLIVTHQTHIPIWGSYVTTPFVSEEYASVRVRTRVEGVTEMPVLLKSTIYSADGSVVAQRQEKARNGGDNSSEQNFIVSNPQCWSPETPNLYTLETELWQNDTCIDRYETRFGIRTVQVVPDKGFYLNGKNRKFRGVCNHHDLGALGAAVNKAALRRQLTLLKDMGCDAIRTAHNMPAQELVELCDEMGFMMMIEPFDEWDQAKCANGYHRFFAEWAEKDMVNMIHHFRNNPCVVMWSIGNEVPTQCSPEGYKVASFLQDICHREDPTRSVTCGMDQVSCVLENGFAAMLDVPGLNYRAHRYQETYDALPRNVVLGSETSSTVSSRGVYKFPVVIAPGRMYPDHQSSSYDVEYCDWSNLPDDDMALAEDHEWTMGQFVWTGFDYLGEPSPYDTDAWPSHSSLFGIIDLATLPKDRFYYYRSIWNNASPTLHVLPHWTWEGREGEVTPVFVYTSYPSAELFINGKSQGIRKKSNETLQHRYRLMWSETRYEPGEVKVVAYDEAGVPREEKRIRTAGKPAALKLISDRDEISADGKDLAYITVQVVDKAGNICPSDHRKVSFRVKGAGYFRAAANGDPTSLDLFHEPVMPLFNGQLAAIVQNNGQQGEITFEASAPGVKSASFTIRSR